MNPAILFVFPSFKEEDFLEFILTYHLGVGYILAYLKQKGIHAKQFIHREPIGLNDLAEKILGQKSKIIGFTCFDTNYYFVKLISQLLKKKNPGLIIIVGGPTATFSDELIMKDNPAIDICVRGEGEYTVYELVKQLMVSSDISNVKGITYRFKDKIVRTPDRDLIRIGQTDEELDILPSPYLNNIFPCNDNFGILTSRGCVFRCLYCNFSAMSRWTIRYHSVERVISELKTISESFENRNSQTENSFVAIWDDTFSLNIERAKQICRRIIEEKIYLPFLCYTRADRVDKEFLYLIRKIGFKEVTFGLESAVPRVLNTIKKVREKYADKNNLIPEKIFIEKVKKNVRLAKKIGLNPSVNVIMGLPGATLKDDKKTIEFVRRLKVEIYYHDYLMLYAGTELFKTYKRYGLGKRRPLTTLPYQTRYAYDVYKIPEMENSLQTLTNRNHMEKLMRMVTGEYDNIQGGGYPDLLFRGYPMNNKTIEWLYESIAISPTIGFISDYFEDKFARKNIEKMILSGLPIANFYFLGSLNKRVISPDDLDFESGRYELNFVTEILLHRRKSFTKLDILEFIPFANYMRQRIDSRRDAIKKDTGRMIFTLSKLSDIENLVGLISNSNELILEGGLAKFDCCFLDECRWSDKDCPAVRFQRGIIQNNGSIIPCFNGKSIAKVGDDRRNIINNLRILWSDIKKERGCGVCPLRDNCSKCLFPYPMNSKDYCRMRREEHSNLFLGIGKIFKLLKILRKIKTFNKDIFLKSRFDRITAALDNELAILSIGKKKYIYHYLDR